MGIILAVLLFSLIVIIHELGHFLMAKANGIVVFEFALGMGPILFKKKIGETVYCVKLLPLGGSCMMGEDDLDVSEDEDEEEDDKEDEIKDIDSDSEVKVLKGNFNEKSVWARMLVIAGGPLFNFLLAWVFAIIMIFWVGFGNTEIGSIQEDSAAYEAGLEAGDVITAINGRNIYLWSEISVYNTFNPGEITVMEYEREGSTYEVTLQAGIHEDGYYYFGITSTGYQDANIIEAVQYGAYTVRYWIFTVIDSLKMMVSGAVSMDDVSGPVGIVSIVDETYEVSSTYGIGVVIYNLMNLTVLLSANLGVMNLLPIPALDGGRLVFLIIEAIRGKRLAPEKEGFIHLIGFALLMILMVVILFNDLLKFF